MEFQGGYLRGLGASAYTGEAGKLRVQADQLDNQSNDAFNIAQNYPEGSAQRTMYLNQAKTFSTQALALRARADAMQSVQRTTTATAPSPSPTPATATAQEKQSSTSVSYSLATQPSQPSNLWSSLMKPRDLSDPRSSLDEKPKSKLVPIIVASLAAGLLLFVGYKVFFKKKKVKKNKGRSWEDDWEEE